MIDTHIHLDDKKYDLDRSEVVKRALDIGIKKFINPGINFETSKNAIINSKKYKNVYAAVGIHPHEANSFEMEQLNDLKNLAKNSKVVAIGEIGLDYYYDFTPKELQIKCFEEQLKLAIQLKLPVIIHNREAHQDTFDLIKKYSEFGLKGVVHCYSGSVEMMKEFIKLGFYIGLDGPITFKNAKLPREVAKSVPIEKLLLETDGPYLAPVPYRGKRNEPMYIREIYRYIAEIKDLEIEVLEKKIYQNAIKCFKKLEDISET